MKAMVLAAGKGTRLFPLTGVPPKPMAPVAGKPVLQHIFDLVTRSGAEEIHVNVHYRADAILGLYGTETQVNGAKIHFTREERLTGTAGGAKRLASAGAFEETFVVIMGDALTDVDLRELVTFHKENGAIATLALKHVGETSEYGVAELDTKKNILRFREKLVGYDEGEFYWSDIGTLESYRTAQRDALSGRVAVEVPGEWCGGGVWISGEAQVHPSAYGFMGGYTFIGPKAVVGRGASLSGAVAVGDECWVSEGATVKQSVLLPGSSVGSGAYLEDCIVGPRYEVRPGEWIRGGALVRGAS